MLLYMEGLSRSAISAVRSASTLARCRARNGLPAFSSLLNRPAHLSLKQEAPLIRTTVSYSSVVAFVEVT